MRVKSYYAASVEAAMLKAGQDMGPDAVLITSRRTGSDTRHLGEYEVVFGLLQDAASGQADNATALANEAVPDVRTQFESVRRELESMRRALSAGWRGSGSMAMPGLAQAESILSEADIAPELAEHLLRGIEAALREETLYNQAKFNGRELKARLRPLDATLMETEAHVSRLLRQQLEAMLEVDPQLGGGASRRVIAVVGPPGAGKTCTLVKLAVAYGLQTRRPSMIVSTDAYRIGATEQLRAYAATIGMAFQAVDSAVALGQVLEEHRSKELVLIDSPGYGPRDIDAGADLARFLSLHPDIQVHLVMPATMRSADVARTTELFSGFGPSRLIITKIDETSAHGALVGQSILSGLPVSFVCNGQQIPDDIEPAAKDRLLGFLRREELGLAASAA